MYLLCKLVCVLCLRGGAKQVGVLVRNKLVNRMNKLVVCGTEQVGEFVRNKLVNRMNKLVNLYGTSW
jgi:hypothetical protein